jgi:micrococcal nuclease
MNHAARLALVILALSAPGVVHAWEGKVIAVDRADQIQVMKDIGRTETVRLYGIHSPGAPQHFGETASQYMRNRVLGKIVRIDPLIVDPFKRVVAWVYLDDECLNKELLRQGMTWWYRKYVPFETELAALEEEARQAKIGLWAYPSPIPPWQFNMSATPAEREQRSPLGKPGMIRERLRNMLSGQEDGRGGQTGRDE